MGFGATRRSLPRLLRSRSSLPPSPSSPGRAGRGSGQHPGGQLVARKSRASPLRGGGVAFVPRPQKDALIGPHPLELAVEEVLADLSLATAWTAAVGPLKVEPDHRRLLEEQEIAHLPPPVVGERVIDLLHLRVAEIDVPGQPA